MMAKKRLFGAIAILLICATMLALTSCNESDPEATKNEYTVTFDSDGGSQVQSATVTEGNKATVPTSPTKSGYVFSGWYIGDRLWVFAEDKVEANITLKAKWTAQPTDGKYVTFNPDGGSGVAPQLINESGKITEPTPPTKTGYTFAGWYVGSTPWNFDTDIATEQTVLKAKWTANVYTITYTLGTSASNATSNPASYTITDDDITISDPLRPGFIFAGWLVGNSTTPVFDLVIKSGSVGNVSLTAKWNVDPNYGKYTISYVLNGGTNADDNPTFFTPSSGTFTIEAPTREYYDFIGWTYEGVTEPVTSVTINAITQLGDKTFTAHWQAKTYTIKYESFGAAHVGNKTTYTADDLPLAINPAYKSEKYFTGWFLDADFTIPASTLTECDNITLYARIISGTDGITYAPTADGTAYAAVSYDGTDEHVYVAYYHNGLPVIEIGNGVFNNCTMTSVTLPSGIKRIGSLAFGGCVLLEKINIPATVEYVGDSAFRGCTALSVSYTLYGGVYYLGDSDAPYTIAMSAAPSLTGAITLHPDTKIISSYAFADATNVTSVALHEGILMLCDHALANLPSLTEIELPDSLKYVGAFAFNGSPAIKFTVLDGVYYLGNDENPYMVLVKVDTTLNSFTVNEQTTVICAYAFSGFKTVEVIFEGDKSQIFIDKAGNELLFAEDEQPEE